ncbi:phospholipase D-like domain-containing protein [Rubrivivax gelatinosus]|uniref:Cardiolipin synthase n=1 Tax=Rubrivivax gelatinosus TaxID=28068 RepID=A0A4R2MAK8_RUBGE|nr:phosphatidylserine/phosphatidylglycerophosphate/cardiolipin synthase family protein [Rubrivivax gelatinosus]MBK1686397.1 hypothetical protein [Rubrivivax gelatinosus]TCP04379.1 cardiolipin synthase [Rubrivivax gelatinosus]
MSKSNASTPHRPLSPPTPRSDWDRGLAEPLVGGNRVALLPDAGAAFAAMLDAVDDARDHVNVENLVDVEGPGLDLLRRLESRARAGVRVNLLVDRRPLGDGVEAALQPLRRSGVSLGEHDSAAWSGLFPGAPRCSEPRELLVVDGRDAFIGGLDVATGRGLPQEARPGPRLQVQGPVLQRLQRLFVVHWQRFARGPMQQARYFPALAPAGLQRMGVAAADSGERNPFVEALLAAVGAATRRVLLASPCEQPPRRLIQALVQASGRGAAVELTVPRAGSGLLRGMPMRQALHAAGVVVHEAQPGRWHARLSVVDGEWVGIGSARLDWRNVVRDGEAGIVVVDSTLAGRLEQMFADDVRRTRGAAAPCSTPGPHGYPGTHYAGDFRP